MTFCKTRLFCAVSLTILLLEMLSVVALSQGLEVPDAECPSPFMPPNLPLCQWVPPWESPTCSRVDTAIMVTDPGVAWSIQGTSVNCKNCDGCPELTPSHSPCSDTLEVTYAEKVTVTLASGGMMHANTIESQMAASIGHPKERTLRVNKTCGLPAGLPGCKTQLIFVAVSVTEGIEKEMEHQYYWSTYITHNPNVDVGDPLQLLLFGCEFCDDYGSLPIKCVNAFARTTSTVEGSSYDADDVACQTEGESDCP